MGRVRLTVAEFSNLTEGQVLELRRPPEAPVDLVVGGRVVGAGRADRHSGRARRADLGHRHVIPFLAMILAVDEPIDGVDGGGSGVELIDSPGESLVQMAVILVVVLVVAVLFLRYVVPRLSRLGVPVRGSGKVIKVVDKCPLEPRRTVYLIDVAGRHLLIGVSENSITHLSGAEVDEELIRRALGAESEGGFARVLKAVAGRKRSDSDAS